MLIDKIADIEKREPGLLVQRTGACRFCGQMATLEAPETWSDEDIDELAVENCKCGRAGIYAGKKKRKERAKKAILDQFGMYLERGAIDETTMDLLSAVTDQVVEDKIQAGTIDIGGGLKAKISTTAKGTIKVEKVKTEKEKREA